jgi:dimeric dUTPase (all-alpha-NTP-PPase superfamily)
MNLTKLFETQKILRDRIGYNEPDRFNKLVLALLVELGECANEWRGFKFWSKNQKPRTKKFGIGFANPGGAFQYETNPLLEEYVDGLHFILELGLEINLDTFEFYLLPECGETVTEQFNWIFTVAVDFRAWKNQGDYNELISSYIHLGKMLGFTWEEVEQAYYSKNKINHQRQEEGY